MHYEINVSLHGKHYFATHPRSLDTLQETKNMVTHFSLLFPEEKDYRIDIALIEEKITRYNINDFYKSYS
jgi:hypothetical protein